MTATKTRRRARKPDPQRQLQLEARKEDIETAALAVRTDEPDVAAFLARWGDRYAESNLLRLWVQCPTATALHKFPTWRGMGRQVRRGEHAILLMQPRVSYDDAKVSAANPTGEVFHGASWMSLFDFSQTDEAGEFTDEAAPGADPALVAEVRRLRMAAADAHPDRGGTLAGFMAAWAAYETARDRLYSNERTWAR